MCDVTRAMSSRQSIRSSSAPYRQPTWPFWAVWAILAGACLLSAAFIFSIMKRLERVAKA